MKVTRVFIGMSAALVLLVSACGGAGAPTPAGSSAAAPNAQATKPPRATVKVSVDAWEPYLDPA